LPRADQLQALKDKVGAGQGQPVAITGKAARVGLQGMGGIGKSVLATALARDEQVRQAFPQGVLWVTLGQAPAITLRQAQLAEALGDGPRAFADAQQGKARLSDSLAEKACLLILDDVWQAEHVGAFEVLGPACGMVITTRDAGMIAALGATEHPLDLLSDEQARALIADWAGQTVESLPAVALEVVQECGNLPLALAMIGAMVRGRPGRWENALDKLRQADLESIRQQFPQYPYPNFLRAVQVSVEALEVKDRERYLDFAVFPEDTPVPEGVLQTFWGFGGLKQYEVQDVVDRLVGRSLVRRDDRGRLSLHDLQFDFVCKRAEGKLPELHQRLLRSYARGGRGREGLWHLLPADGYIHGRLAWHLEQAGDVAGVHALLREETPAGRNGWYEATERLGQLAVFADDVARAGRLADEAFRAGAGPPALGLRCRYALMAASLNSLAARLPPALLSALVRQGVWPVELAVAYARRVPEPVSRVRGLMALIHLPQLPAGEQEAAVFEALQAARAILDEGTRSGALAALAPQLPAGQREAVLAEAVQAARALGDEWARAEALAALAPQLAGFPRATLTSLWLETIVVLSTRSRQDLLADLQALIPVLNALAGDDASAEFREISQAIMDVGRWWP
jgi:hypothetical protein